MRTLLIEQTAAGGQMVFSDTVENYPASRSIGGAELSQHFLDHAQDYNLEVHSREIFEVEPGLTCHRVKMADGTTLKTHTLILAAGAAPGKLGVLGEDELYRKGFFFRNKVVPAGVKFNGDGYTVTDDKCETDIKGISAIGDLRGKYARQIVVTAADGCTAALAAAHRVVMQRTIHEGGGASSALPSG